MAEGEILLSVREAAAILKIHPSTVYELLNTGDVPGVIKLHHVGVRIHKETLLKWLEKQAKINPALKPKLRAGLGGRRKAQPQQV